MVKKDFFRWEIFFVRAHVHNNNNKNKKERIHTHTHTLARETHLSGWKMQRFNSIVKWDYEFSICIVLTEEHALPLPLPADRDCPELCEN